MLNQFRFAVSTEINMKHLLYTKQLWTASEQRYMLNQFQRIQRLNTQALIERSLGIQFSILEKLEKHNQVLIKEPFSTLITNKRSYIMQTPTIFKIYNAQQEDLIRVDKPTLLALIDNIRPRIQQKAEVGFSMDGFQMNEFYSNIISLRLATIGSVRFLIELYQKQISKLSSFHLLRYIDISSKHSIGDFDVLVPSISEALYKYTEFATLYDVAMAAHVHHDAPATCLYRPVLESFIERVYPVLNTKVDKYVDDPSMLRELLNTRAYGFLDLERYFDGTPKTERVRQLIQLSKKHAKRLNPSEI